MPDNLVNRLKQIPLFAKLGRDDLEAIAALVKRERYPAGSVICRQGEVGLTGYFVESGELRILHVNPQGIEQEVGRLGPGEYLGETSLLLGEPRDATVEVTQDATLLYLNKGEFDQLLDKRPGILRALQMSPGVAKKRRARRFKWQDPEEVVIIRLHKHNAILFRNLFFPCFVLLVDLVGCGYWYLQSGSTLALTAGALLGLVPFLFTLYLTVDHFNDNYILTNKRVVHEERVPLIIESRAEAFLRTVQNIQQLREGPLAQLFNFGDLMIETAGERGLVVFRQIPNPAEVQDAIFEQIRRVQAMARAGERANIRDALRRQFGVSAPEATVLEPEAPRPKRRFKLSLPSWLLVPVHFFGYFLPSLRHEQGDTITWRKHWIALIRPIALPTALIIAATFISTYLLVRIPYQWIAILTGYGVVMVFLFPWWLWVFDDWQNDIYQVTSTRIIDVERLPFYLREERREASLAVIQNISLEVPGVLGRLLNYGSVTIETAGVGAFTFDYVKDPRGVQTEIFRRVEAFQRRQRQEAAERHRSELLDWFAVYDQVYHSKPPASQSMSSQQQEL
jgi:CRP/FNR family cyclic AMP-dependent transcriptional regulator